MRDIELNERMKQIALQTMEKRKKETVPIPQAMIAYAPSGAQPYAQNENVLIYSNGKQFIKKI